MPAICKKAVYPDIDMWIEEFEKYVDGNALSVTKINGLVNRLGKKNPYQTKYFAWLFARIICADVSLKCLKGMAYSKFLERFIEEFEGANLLLQDKKHGSNLLEHSLLTLDSVDVIPVELIIGIKKWEFIDPIPIISFACLLHDIGKMIDIDAHESYGAYCAGEIGDTFSQYVGNDYLGDYLYDIVLNHMRPFGYQRGEDWGDSAIKQFIYDCNGIGSALMTLCVAIADKFASTNNPKDIERLIELFYRCEELHGSTCNKET